MERGQCWMWTKRKHSMSANFTSPTNPSYDDSWEEQAFAEDAAGPLGGCIWPPRSYTCSFCRREFRSAQALGGHMNVHRRDRARLKQPSSPQNDQILYHDLETHHHNPVQNSFSSLGYLVPSPACGLAYNTSPNSSDPAVIASPSSSSPSKALVPSINENCREETLIPLYDSSILQGYHKASPVYSSKSWSNLADTGKNSKILDSECGDKEDIHKTDVAVSLNFSVCQARPTVPFETKEEATINCKKRRTDASSSSFFPKSSSVERNHLQSQMFELSPSSIEELDLELRLGHCSPKELFFKFDWTPEVRRYFAGCDNNNIRNYRQAFCKLPPPS